MALLGTALLAAAPALAQPAPAAGGPPARGERGPGAIFNQIDRDRDGKVTWDEAWVYVQQRFTTADRDHDGGLTQEELAAAFPRRGQAGAQTPADRGQGAGRTQMLGMMFRGLDANRDGKVTLEEIRPAAEARFRGFDANGDGAVARTSCRGGRAIIGMAMDKASSRRPRRAAKPRRHARPADPDVPRQPAQGLRGTPVPAPPARRVSGDPRLWRTRRRGSARRGAGCAARAARPVSPRGGSTAPHVRRPARLPPPPAACRHWRRRRSRPWWPG
ncbi:EF-hand domain-containing protein [Siccirubricoccus deserti]